MNEKPMVEGREIFGGEISSHLARWDLYDDEDAALARMMLDVGRLESGGPPVDLQKLHELYSQRAANERARQELKELSRFQTWFRHLHALNLRDQLNPRS